MTEMIKTRIALPSVLHASTSLVVYISVSLLVGIASPAGLRAQPSSDTTSAPEPLGLQRAVQLALERNETLLIALEDRNWATAAVKEAYAGALPNVEFQGSYQYNITRPAFFVSGDLEGGDGSGGVTKIEIGGDYEAAGQIRLDQILYAFGRVGNAVDFAKIYKEMASLGVENARNQVMFYAKAAYYRVLLAEHVADIRLRSLRQAESHLDQVSKKLSQGTVSRFDFLRAQVEVKNREPGLIAAENDLSLAQQDLKRILGIEGRPDPVLTDSLAFFPVDLNEEQAVSRAYSLRPEIRSLQLNVEGKEKIVAIEKAGRWPTLGLFGQLLFQGQADDNPLDPFDSSHRAVSSAAGIAVTMPIFDGFRTKARVQQARAELRRAQHELERVRKAVRLEVVKAVKEIRAASRAYEAQTATVSLAEEAYAIAETRFGSGLSTQLELTDAQTALEQARVNYATTLYRYDVAVANLEKSIGLVRGSGFEGDVGDSAGRED